MVSQQRLRQPILTELGMLAISSLMMPGFASDLRSAVSAVASWF